MESAARVTQTGGERAAVASAMGVGAERPARTSPAAAADNPYDNLRGRNHPNRRVSTGGGGTSRPAE